MNTASHPGNSYKKEVSAVLYRGPSALARLYLAIDLYFDDFAFEKY